MTIVGVLSVCAQATLIVQTQNYSGTPTFSQGLTFNQFDDMGGTRILQSILVEATLNVQGGALRLDNDSESVGSGQVTFGGQLLLTPTGVFIRDSGGNDIIQPGDVKPSGTSPTITLQPDDGDTEVGGTPNFSSAGTDYGFYNGTAQSDSDSGYVGSSYWSAYLGTGTYNISADVTQVADYSAFSGVQAQIDPLTADGTVTITYNYEDYVIPEPATMALLSLGIGGMVFRRRKRA